MKKVLIFSVSTLLLLSSCGTYAGAGAYTGSTLGSILGSAIGGITGGARGSDIGTIVGMAGGAIVGAAIGDASEKAEQQKYEAYKQQRAQRNAIGQRDDSGFDPNNGGDDRIVFEEGNGYPETDIRDAETRPALQIRHARLLDTNKDGILTRGEYCTVVFEIMNTGGRTAYNVQPVVLDVTRNKHLHISPNLRVESIAPGKGIRYSATIKADNRLKNGHAVIRVGVAQGRNEVPGQWKELTIVTRKRR